MSLKVKFHKPKKSKSTTPVKAVADPLLGWVSCATCAHAEKHGHRGKTETIDAQDFLVCRLWTDAAFGRNPSLANEAEAENSKGSPIVPQEGAIMIYRDNPAHKDGKEPIALLVTPRDYCEKYKTKFSS